MQIGVSGVKSGSSFESLLMTIGFVVVQWGHCEQSVELLVTTLFGDYGGNKLRSRRKMPRQISEKICFLKECGEQIGALASFRTELDALASDFEHVLQLRHDLIHGALASTDCDDGIFNFIRLDTHPSTPVVKAFQYDLREFPVLEALLIDLGRKATSLACRVFAARP